MNQTPDPENPNTHQLFYQDKQIILIGTAHVSRKSAEEVSRVIEEERPDTVSVELCQSRYQSLTQKKRWEETDLIKAIKEKKAFLLLSNLMLSYFQKRIGKKLGIRPGEEMVKAIEGAEAIGAHIHLADRDIRTTLSRVWRLMGLWTKVKLSAQLVTSAGELDSLSEEDIEKIKRADVLETLLSEIGEALPEMRTVLIDERDQYLAHRIRTAPGQKIVAVVGAGHVPGIHKNWDQEVDMEALEQMPPKGKMVRIIKWAIPCIIVSLIALGFFKAGASAGTDMIKWWVLANAVLAGLGASVALAHPLTILTAVVASPITSLNPMIAAGWVAGLVELLIGKPKVKDFEALPDDISTLKGFWRNKITRILMVVVFTNIGSSLGAFVAIPLMLKVLA
ncbi:MAG: TraB/GumN family protein [Deltaproteobacteria bacterium]|nr:TraB/GumN family protein [Deltaproteobacteria bacterium]MBW2207462.1 TraB/GumN family protein [Deltaproteobacteria bacterium]